MTLTSTRIPTSHSFMISQRRYTMLVLWSLLGHESRRVIHVETEFHSCMMFVWNRCSDSGSVHTLSGYVCCPVRPRLTLLTCSVSESVVGPTSGRGGSSEIWILKFVIRIWHSLWLLDVFRNQGNMTFFDNHSLWDDVFHNDLNIHFQRV
jgi:hypothetical protein